MIFRLHRMIKSARMLKSTFVICVHNFFVPAVYHYDAVHWDNWNRINVKLALLETITNFWTKLVMLLIYAIFKKKRNGFAFFFKLNIVHLRFYEPKANAKLMEYLPIIA